MTSNPKDVKSFMESHGFEQHQTVDGIYWVHPKSFIQSLDKKNAAYWYEQTMDAVREAEKGIFDWHARLKHTLIIDRSRSTCGNCGVDANPEERNHDTRLGYGVHNGEPACHFYWKYVTSGYPDTEEAVRKMRPDLEWMSYYLELQAQDTMENLPHVGDIIDDNFDALLMKTPDTKQTDKDNA